MNLSIQYAERVYNAMLSLYPVRFRIRFGPEMAQLFRDCCHDALEKGEVAVLVAFWVAAVRDLLLSAVLERSRELTEPLGVDHPLVGLVDATLIPSMVGMNLLALGPVLTLLVAGVAIPTEQFVMTSGFFSIVLGSLAVVASLAITRLRPTERLWVKLSV
jgi:hypothetical protein